MHRSLSKYLAISQLIGGDTLYNSENNNYAQIMSKYLVISQLIGGDTLYNSENNNYAE